MAKSNRENEIKLAFPSAETAVRRLLAIGAREIQARTFEDNVLLDCPNRAPRDERDDSFACGGTGPLRS
jgi:hypothetical protein